MKQPMHRTPPMRTLEELEPRIAPAGLGGIKYDPVTLGNPQVVEAGQGLATALNGGSYLLAVEKGAAMVFSTDLNGNGRFDPNEITGIAASDGLRITLFADLNGDMVTNLTKRFDPAFQKNIWVLSDSDLDPSNNNPRIGGDGLVLLNSRIESITLRSVTDADIPGADLQKGVTARDRLALSSYSIFGNILAGGGVGARDGGVLLDASGIALQASTFTSTNANYQLATILPNIGSIRTGTAAAPGPSPTAPDGQFFSFGYQTTGLDTVRGSLVVGGHLLPYAPAFGQAGGDILNVSAGPVDPVTGVVENPSPLRINAIMTGDGGVGARGGNIENVLLSGESGGLRIVAGDGGDGPAGGAGGSILNLQDFGSTNSVVEIRAGDGGRGFLGQAGAAGAVSFGRFETNGMTYIGLGSGGAGFTSSGAGTSLNTATLAPTDINGVALSTGVISSHRLIGDITTQRMADFNQDGFSDMIYLTTNPDQIIMKFGTAAGIADTTPTLYFAAPAFGPMTGGAGAVTTSGLVIADFNNDSWLDFAVGSSETNSFDGIRTFLNPGNGFRPDAVPSLAQPRYNGWFTDGLRFAETAASPQSRAIGQNYIDSYIHSPLPFLNSYSASGDIQRSGMPLTDMVAGDFDGLAWLNSTNFDAAALITSPNPSSLVDGPKGWTFAVTKENGPLLINTVSFGLYGNAAGVANVGIRVYEGPTATGTPIYEVPATARNLTAAPQYYDWSNLGWSLAADRTYTIAAFGTAGTATPLLAATPQAMVVAPAITSLGPTQAGNNYAMLVKPETYDLGVILQVWKNFRIDADRPWTSLLAMSGTGDGRFFADFNYDPTVGVQTQLNMPLYNGTTTGPNPVITGSGSGIFSKDHNNIALRSTAPTPNAAGGAGAEVLVGATLLYRDDERVQSVQLSQVLGRNLTALQPVSVLGAVAAPRYYDPIIVNGNIVGWNTETGRPVDITITDIGGDGFFDIMVVNEQDSISMITPLNVDPATGLPAPINSGVVLNGQRGDNTRVGGVPPNATVGGAPAVRQPIENFPGNVEFRAIVAGNFSTFPDPANPGALLTTNLALLSMGNGDIRREFFPLFFPGLLAGANPNGDQWANLVYPQTNFAAVTPGADRIDPRLVAFDLFAVTPAPVLFGIAQANATVNQDDPRGVFTTGFEFPYRLPDRYVATPNLINTLSLVAGDGGDSYFGSGGVGGSIGLGSILPPAQIGGTPVGSFTLLLPTNEYIQPQTVVINAGRGGDGFVNGGRGGEMTGIVVAFRPGVNASVTGLITGDGGNGLLGSGGAGGRLTQFSVERGSDFVTGAGGIGNIGGAGGNILGGGGSYGPNTTSRVVSAVAGDGGRGVAGGGAGGSFDSFFGTYQLTTGGDAGSLLYVAGQGGSAVSGLGGAGGSIRKSSPAERNFNTGPIVLTAGAGGDGLGGGAGGSIVDFINVPSGEGGGTSPTIVSAVAGRGGDGVTRNGGAGGGIVNFDASGNGLDFTIDGQFNRVVAGDAGAGYGSLGGVGGSVLNSVAPSGASGAAAAAGSGGAGLSRGGAGGSISNVTLDSTDDNLRGKVIVMAGHGGAAYAATPTAPGVALRVGDDLNATESPVILALRAFGGANGVGGNGGGIDKFTQSTDPARPNAGAVNTAVDLVAGNGGDLANYGAVQLFTTNTVGLGGSVTNVQLAGEAGRSAREVAIKSYGSDFVDRILRNGWGTQLDDTLGNVGVVAGAAGAVKNGLAGDGPGKNGAVTALVARSIMSIVAGSVDEIAAVKTVSGLNTSTGILGAWKTNPVNHADTPLYFTAAGNPISSPVLGGRLMDGAIVTQSNPNNLSSARLFVR